MSLRIKAVIKDKGMTVQELADKMGISRIGLSQHINGNPSVGVLERIADALNVPITDLFERNSNDEINGYIKAKGQLFEIKSLQDMENLLKKIQDSK